jgi:hypothetical protein
MIEIALHRALSRDIACSAVRREGQGDTNRGWQDKNRKVRTVGWVRNSAKSELFANIASVSRNLHFSTTRYRRSTIDTLRKDR